MSGKFTQDLRTGDIDEQCTPGDSGSTRSQQYLLFTGGKLDIRNFAVGDFEVPQRRAVSCLLQFHAAEVATEQAGSIFGDGGGDAGPGPILLALSAE